MLNALLGRKVGMTQVFGPNGTVIPVTVIEAGPCIVTQIKTVAHDGYEAVQIGFEQATLKNRTRAELGHLGHSLPLLKAQRRPGPELGPFKALREVELQEGVAPEKLELGKQFDASLFTVGEAVDIV